VGFWEIFGLKRVWQVKKFEKLWSDVTLVLGINHVMLKFPHKTKPQKPELEIDQEM
jgi:hypothetical protein